MLDEGAIRERGYSASMRQRWRVLLVTHTAEIGGAEIALLRLIDAIDAERFELSACLFARGALERELMARGIVVHLLDADGVDRVTDRKSVV